MKTKRRPPARTSRGENGTVQHVAINGERMVALPEPEYKRLLQKADEWEPPMPELDGKGTYPAVEALCVSLARKIIRDRRRLGLTQAELARAAGIRLATLQSAESGKRPPSVATVDKIDRALSRLEKKTR
jgi:DNA-binding XRE family transcriptional regulator